MRDFRLLILMVVALIAGSCKKTETHPEPQPVVEVTYTAIDGSWQLTSWCDGELGEQTYLYITFDGDSRRFEMWDNLGSMYTQHKSGTFSINQNTNKEYVLSGIYDNGVGDWNNEYVVRMTVDCQEMEWQNNQESMTFNRIDAIPELN